MKKWLIMLIVMMITIFATQSMAIDAGAGISTGMLMEKSQKPAVGYSLSVDAPLVTKADTVGNVIYTIKTYADYMYADRTDTEEEVSVLRTFVMYERELIGSFNVGIGGGMWTILNTGGEDVVYTAFRLKAGIKIIGLDTYIAQDLVRVNKGNDMYYTTFNVNPF